LGRNSIVETLLEHGADPKITDNEGNTAYQAALNNGWIDTAAIFFNITEPVNRISWIKSPDGMEFIDHPLSYTPVIQRIPYGDKVFVIAESIYETEYYGQYGRWNNVEWNGQQGWVFGTELTDEPDLAILIMNEGKYTREVLEGMKNTDAIIDIQEEIIFSTASSCEYILTEYFFDAKVISKQTGSYTVEGDTIRIQLAGGTSITEFYEDFGMPDQEEIAAPKNIVLTWINEASGFLRESEFERINSEGFSFDPKTNSYTKETDTKIETIGIFLPE
jgi:hypothetical protein